MSSRNHIGPAGRSCEIDFIRERVSSIRGRAAEWMLVVLLAACAVGLGAMLATVVGEPVALSYWPIARKETP